jgi:hypothetical protein
MNWLVRQWRAQVAFCRSWQGRAILLFIGFLCVGIIVAQIVSKADSPAFQIFQALFGPSGYPPKH